MQFEYRPVIDDDGKSITKWKFVKSYVDSETLDKLSKSLNLTRENIRKIRSLRMQELKKILEKEGYEIWEAEPQGM